MRRFACVPTEQALHITDVMLSLRIFSSKIQSEQGFLFFFVGGKKNICIENQ
jgi:hypothetical protein